MDIFKTVSFLIVLCAGLGYINAKFIKLPHIIGLLILSLIVSVVLWTGSVYWEITFFREILIHIDTIDFGKVLLNVMLCFMLFAGSFHANSTSIRRELKSITILAFFGTIMSTFLVGFLLFYISGWMNVSLPLIYCLLFGALISPTDPIAVLGIINKSGIQERIKTNIIGESLFNDGIGIVIFITILEMTEHGNGSFSVTQTLLLFVREAVGGIALGFLAGYIAFVLLKSINNYEVEILVTIALVMGSYFIADYFQISGPLAMVVAGLIIGGDHLRNNAMSHKTEAYMGKFWELIDLGLNSILFVLIGLKLASFTYDINHILLGVFAIIILLFARMVCVKLLSALFRKQMAITSKEQLILVWSGLRGGLSLAMALSISNTEFNTPIIFITYMIVLFSIIVQGLTVEKLANR